LILYGIPSHGFLEISQDEGFILGGCMTNPKAPIYHCKRCKTSGAS